MTGSSSLTVRKQYQKVNKCTLILCHWLMALKTTTKLFTKAQSVSNNEVMRHKILNETAASRFLFFSLLVLKQSFVVVKM